MRRIDVKLGDRYNRLTIIDEVAGVGKSKRRRFLCGCSCGNKKEINLDLLMNGTTKSCGCLNDELKRARSKHGLSSHKTYFKLKNMRQRCNDKRDKGYKNYGGRGITVCEEWSGDVGLENFYNWAISNGYEEGLTIDRIDNDKGYCPANCRWVDMSFQGANKRIASVNTSGFIGVFYIELLKKWRAQVQYRGKIIFKEYYKDKREGALGRDKFIIENNLPHTLSRLTKKEEL